MQNLFAQPLQLFTGKGGVGKTSVVAALAACAARHGHRPLVVEMGHRASLQGLFDTEKIGYQPRHVGHGVWAMNMGFEAALLEYVTQHVRLGILSRAIVENRALRGFFDAAPAVQEVVTLNKLRALIEDQRPTEPRFHPVFVDLDATGHALMLLELPSVIEGLVGAGPLRRLLGRLSSLLLDPVRTCLHLVSLPGELPVEETIELHARLVKAHGVPFGALFVNKVPEAPFATVSERRFDELERHAQSTADQALLDDLQLGRRAVEIYRLARVQIDKLVHAIRLPAIELPRLSTTRPTFEELLAFGESALEQWVPISSRRPPRAQSAALDKPWS